MNVGMYMIAFSSIHLQAILGGTIQVPTLTGDVVLKVLFSLFSRENNDDDLMHFVIGPWNNFILYAGSSRNSTWSKSSFKGER